MIVVYILLGLLMLLVLALAVPVYARVVYDGQLRVRLRVWGFPVALLPEQEKATPEKKKKPKRTAKGDQADKAPSKWEELKGYFKEDGPAALLHYLAELAKLTGQAVGKVLAAITVDKLELELLIAADDPADTAVRYGQVCSVLYPALAAIETRVKVKKRQLRVEPGFLAEKSDARLDLRLHLRVWQALWAALGWLVKFMMIKDTAPAVKEKEDIQHVK